MDFNAEGLGGVTLLRAFLDRMPDTELPLPEIPWPPLEHEPLKEQYGVLQPIRNLDVPEEMETFAKPRDFE